MAREDISYWQCARAVFWRLLEDQIRLRWSPRWGTRRYWIEREWRDRAMKFCHAKLEQARNPASWWAEGIEIYKSVHHGDLR